ncbi:conserved hypothetical protein [Roseibium sp. TrichSKD4]|nr:conserved hypothetical protein [Roseibium sp. TrichSKD4]
MRIVSEAEQKSIKGGSNWGLVGALFSLGAAVAGVFGAS